MLTMQRQELVENKDKLIIINIIMLVLLITVINLSMPESQAATHSKAQAPTHIALICNINSKGSVQ